MSKFIRGLGSFIGIGGGLLGFILSLIVVYSMSGFGGVLGGLFLFPLVFTLLPFYAGFAFGNWTLFLINYGSAAVYWFLHSIADNIDKNAATPQPLLVPTIAPSSKTAPVEGGNLGLTLTVLVIGSLVLAGILVNLSGSSSAPAPTQTRSFAPTQTATTSALPTRTAQPVSLDACVTDSTINIRRGPGRDFESVGGIASGKCVSILGRNQDSTWVYILADTNAVAGENTGWVLASLLTIDGNIRSVAVRSTSNALSVAPTQKILPTVTARIQPTVTRRPIVFFTATPRPAFVLPCSITANSSGDLVTCQIQNVSCDYFPDVDGSPTFCNDIPYPNHNFTLVIFGDDWSDLDGSCIVVTGEVFIFRGLPQIEAFSRSQISFC